MAPGVVVREVIDADAPAIASIYNHYVLHTTVTFEETPVSAEEMLARIGAVRAAGRPWFVVEAAGQLCGYAYATPWKPRFGYRFSVEVSVYLEPSASGRGLGSLLYEALFAALAASGVHSAVGGIALPNSSSVRLHEKFGMTKVAHFAQIGTKFGEWIDVGYWQRVFDQPAP